jgi:hypothetical protein
MRRSRLGFAAVSPKKDRNGKRDRPDRRGRESRMLRVREVAR